jgi:hypothetical protein
VDGEQTVLVTGGSGFLGGWCLTELLQRGYRARTTVRNLACEAEVRASVGSQVDVGDRLTVLPADLTEDQGWAEAIGGCDYVLHVASPFPPAQPKDPDELIVPARDGTLRVLRESLAAGVERVVVTSSVAAVRNAGPGANTRGRELTEADWSDPDDLHNFIEQWPKKLIGFAAAFFFGHRPARALIDDIQLWFAERRVALGKGVRVYQTPPFKARYNAVAAGGTVQARARGRVALPLAMTGLGLAVVALGGYGYYVLNYIAK